MDRDLSKLPVWARHRIEKLEADVEWWKSKAVKAEAGEASIWMVHGLDEDIPLAQAGETIRFDMAPGSRIDVRFDKQHPGELYVSASGRLGGDIVVTPQSSNVIRVAARPW